MKMSWYVGPNEECILVRESHWQSMGDVPETELTKGSLREPGIGNNYETSKKKMDWGKKEKGYRQGNRKSLVERVSER